MTDHLPPELGPQLPPTPAQGGLRQSLEPLAQAPEEKFFAELMSIASETGILDQSFQPETVADQTDIQDANANPLELLTEQQIVKLVDLFLAIPEEKRIPLEQKLREAFPPQVSKQLDAIIRFAQQRGAGQGGQGGQAIQA